MKIIVIILGVIIFTAGLNCPAFSHSVHYQVANKGISVRVFYAEDDPASYSSYEIFGHGDTIPHQKGRTDKNGFVSFLPDRQGKWVIKVFGESEHGMHGAQIEVNVNENLFMDSFKKPLVAKYTKAFVGISCLLAFFGFLSLLKSWKRGNTE
ncbi:MAG: hypothetical protein RDU01_05090 [Thermodesulfovibrionales bacterium]|nr:hypothetical protein [Thermodesulfovibrionales bacterium]